MADEKHLQRKSAIFCNDLLIPEIINKTDDMKYQLETNHRKKSVQ